MKRRSFLKSVGIGAVAAVVGPCVPGTAKGVPMTATEVLKRRAAVDAQTMGRSTDVTLGLIDRPDYGAESAPKDFWADVRRIVIEAKEGELIGANRAGMNLLIETAATRWGIEPDQIRAAGKLHCGKLFLHEVVMPGPTDYPQVIAIPRFCTYSITSYKGVEFRLVGRRGPEHKWRDNPYLRGLDPDGLFPKFEVAR